MTAASLLNDLEHHQSLLLDNVRRTAADYNRQFHPDLSPLGWHLGHCVYTEIYWLREQLLEDTAQCGALKALYVPELMPKTRRAAALPDFEQLHRWARRTQRDNLQLLLDLLDSGRGDPLLQEDYVAHFLTQHYAQHYETTLYILAQRQQQRDAGGTVPPRPSATAPPQDMVVVPAGRHCIGTAGTHAYDNEQPAFTVHLPSFRIAAYPVTNADYLRFMADGGYDRPGYWSAEGWRWRTRHHVTAPEHWRQGDDGAYFGIDESGRHGLDPGAPVHGISWYEARACAAWAGARLPHEYEWEAAKRAGIIGGDGRVWEWCANSLHPYEGFRAFPYEGYSVPYFDGRHYVLRGGSDYTRPCIRRPGFRNYYQADKRHIRAGLRLVRS